MGNQRQLKASPGWPMKVGANENAASVKPGGVEFSFG
jgi:hypothetical protein